MTGDIFSLIFTLLVTSPQAWRARPEGINEIFQTLPAAKTFCADQKQKTQIFKHLRGGVEKQEFC